MTFIDGTVVNVALPALQAGLQATITDVQWVIEAYALFLGAGLLAIAVFDLVLARTFDAEARSRLDRLRLTPAARAAIDRELPRMAGADVGRVTSMSSDARASVREAIAGAFVAGFRVVMFGAAAVAVGAAGAGAAIRE